MAEHTARYWREKGLVLRDEQRMPEATQALARATELEPDNWGIAFDYAQTCYASGLPAANLLRELSIPTNWG